MIAALRNNQGELYIDGKLINDVRPRQGYCHGFQNYALISSYDGFENMSFGLRIRKMPKNEIKRRVDEAARIRNRTS